MKAMLIHEFGGPEVFEPAELPKPQAAPSQVLMRVAATSVNTVDTMIRQMGPALPLSPATPALLGMDFAGRVEAVGEGVTGFAVGDEVYGCAGGLAEYMAADARLIAHKPTSLSMAEAAALPCGHQTRLSLTIALGSRLSITAMTRLFALPHADAQR